MAFQGGVVERGGASQDCLNQLIALGAESPQCNQLGNACENAERRGKSQWTLHGDFKRLDKNRGFKNPNAGRRGKSQWRKNGLSKILDKNRGFKNPNAGRRGKSQWRKNGDSKRLGKSQWNSPNRLKDEVKANRLQMATLSPGGPFHWLHWLLPCLFECLSPFLKFYWLLPRLSAFSTNSIGFYLVFWRGHFYAIGFYLVFQRLGF